MTCCVLGITGLQLYWNYKNYQTVVKNLEKDSNEALINAVDEEMNLRHENISLAVKKWLSDTSFITISCNTNNRDSSTVFTMRDTHPYYNNSKSVSIGISNYKEKVKKITPEVKNIFINHFANNIVKGDLKKGIIYFYTPRLGDSLSRVYDLSKVDTKALNLLFKKELANRKIYTSFKLVSKNNKTISQFKTNLVNTALRRPYEKEYVSAILENPNQYYLREMKWLIISSFLLISITLFCFYYTIKTLFNQYKLVAIKNQFISNMTHEINTPLSSIQVTTEALQQFNPDAETRKKYLEIILHQTKKLTDLSSEILANAKLETVAFSIDEKIDLNELLLALIQKQELVANNKINYQPPTEKLIIKGNKVHLSRSIINLIDNAFKYNFSENRIVELKLEKKSKEINLSIIDNGPGIADEYKTKIFDQFYRIPTGNVHDIKGYGLGLSYVKKVITQHLGAINVLDHQPNGSVFCLILPIYGKL